MLETFSKKGRDKMIANASAILRKEAEYRFPSMHYHQDRMRMLKSTLGWSARRVRSIYNGEDGVSLRGEETLRIIELKQAQERREKEEANAASDRAFEERIAALEAELASIRAAVASDHLAGHLGASRGLGRSAHQSRQGHPLRRSTD